MASVARDPGGRKRILFFGADGLRKTVRLGKIELRHAEAIRVRIDSLVSAGVSRQPLDKSTAEWVTTLDDVLYGRLAAAGLVKPRHGRTLGTWLEAFMWSRAKLKPESRRKLEQTRAKLIAFFGEAKPLHEITADQASLWREDLQKQGLSEAAVKTHVGNAKTIMAAAVKRDLIVGSAFGHLKGAVTPPANTRYVTAEETARRLSGCPELEWQVLSALARLGVLRTPSETSLVTVADINWETGRLRVRSPKTERFEGHEKRRVPICPRLMGLLRRRFEQMTDREERLVTIKGAGARRRKMTAIMDRASVERWADTWQTLRRSCEIEWAQHYPQYAVSRWIGHSIMVSGRHYANAIPDELFDRVAGHGAAQIAAQQAAELGRTGSQTPCSGSPPPSRNVAPCQELREGASACECSGKWSRGESNPRPGTVSRAPLRVCPVD